MTKIDGILLLPCPFCGGDDLNMNGNDTYIWVSCTFPNCWAEGPVDLGQSGAIEKWNERKPSDNQ